MRASNRKLDRSLKVVQHINSYFTKEMTHIVLGSKVKLKKKNPGPSSRRKLDSLTDSENKY